MRYDVCTMWIKYRIRGWIKCGVYTYVDALDGKAQTNSHIEREGCDWFRHTVRSSFCRRRRQTHKQATCPRNSKCSQRPHYTHSSINANTRVAILYRYQRLLVFMAVVVESRACVLFGILSWVHTSEQHTQPKQNPSMIIIRERCACAQFALAHTNTNTHKHLSRSLTTTQFEYTYAYTIESCCSIIGMDARTAAPSASSESVGIKRNLKRIRYQLCVARIRTLAFLSNVFGAAWLAGWSADGLLTLVLCCVCLDKLACARDDASTRIGQTAQRRNNSSSQHHQPIIPFGNEMTMLTMLMMMGGWYNCASNMYMYVHFSVYTEACEPAGVCRCYSIAIISHCMRLAKR